MKKFILVILIFTLSLSLLSFAPNEKKAVKKIKKKNTKIYTKEELSFGIKDYEVKGELVIPKNGNKPYKIAIIVGGSGPTNRDGSEEGLVYPYRDIAEGLAEKGIASFRYDKRTFSHGHKLTMEDALDFTVKEEYLDDYNEVINYLSKRKEIDKNNMFTLGHSQGGYLIPMFEKVNNLPKGYVFLAAPVTRLEDLLVEQADKVLQMDEAPVDLKKQAEQWKKQGEKMKAITEDTPNELIGGTSVKYIQYLRKYDVLEDTKKIDKPMIFLQGLSDFKVPERELNLYKEALKGKENVEYKTYEDLTHSFIKVHSKTLTVETEVINDIANFINK